MMRAARGTALACRVDCDRYDVPGYAIDDMNQYGGFEGVETIRAAAALDEENDRLTIFAINADLKDPQLLELDARGFETFRFADHVCLYASSPDDENTYAHPDVIRPVRSGDTKADGCRVSARLEPASLNVFTFVRQRE